MDIVCTPRECALVEAALKELINALDRDDPGVAAFVAQHLYHAATGQWVDYHDDRIHEDDVDGPEIPASALPALTEFHQLMTKLVGLGALSPMALPDAPFDELPVIEEPPCPTASP